MPKYSSATVLLGILVLLVGCSSRPSLEKTGYTAFVFAIDTSDLPADRDVSAEVAAAVLKRLDPDERFGVVCTPLARDQIEIRVQHAPEDVQILSRAVDESIAKLAATNVTEDELLFTLTKLNGRKAALDQLVRSHPTRKAALTRLATAYDAWKENGFDPAYHHGLGDVLATNLPIEDLVFMLETTEPSSHDRKEYLADLRKRFPHVKQQIDDVVTRHEAWMEKGAALYCDDPAIIKPMLEGLGVLEFRILAQRAFDNPTQYDSYRRRLHDDGPQPAPGDEFGWFRVEDVISFFDLDGPDALARFDPQQNTTYVADHVADDYYVLAYLAPDQGLLAEGRPWRVLEAEVDRDTSGEPCVNFELDEAGGALFEELTRRNIGKPLCILVDDTAYSAATIRSRIRANGTITGRFGPVKMTYLARVLAVQLPAPLKFPPLNEREVGPQP
ncbi:MAG: hypothetical protein PVJ57_10760 [Phycisphaerae bacterium]|jgi:hypothetical protein